MTDKTKKTGLALLREPFLANQIGKLPKPTKSQTDAVRADFKEGIRCDACGQWHHPKVVHLDYVGHAALTDRLLDCDLKWNWESVAKAEDGTPKFDECGGLWIDLTVCDVTRQGYGDAPGKTGGNAKKEAIGDALRNAAMRFGAALDLWHKGDLHTDDTAPDEGGGDKADGTGPFNDDLDAGGRDDEADAAHAKAMMVTITMSDEFKGYWSDLNKQKPHIAKRPDVIAVKDKHKAVILAKQGASVRFEGDDKPGPF